MVRLLLNSQRIQEQLDKGLSSNKIIKVLNLTCTRGTLDRFIKANNLQRYKLPVNEIIKLFEAGKYPKDLANEYNVSIHKIYYLLKKAGLDPSKHQYDSANFKHLFNPKDLPVEKIADLVNKRVPIPSIIKMLNLDCHSGSLRKFVLKNKLRTVPFNIVVDSAHIIKLYDNGLKASEIARKLSIRDYTICRVLKNAGYKPAERQYQRNPGQFTNTKPERVMKFVLELLNVKYSHPYHIGKFNIDFFLPEHNLLIDVDGEYWHGRFDQDHEQVKYVREKDKRKEQFVNDNFKGDYIRIWELYTLNRMALVNIIASKLRLDIPTFNIDFKDINIKICDIARTRDFIESFHYSGSVGPHKFIFGAFWKNELIAAVIFKSPTYNNSQCLELSRFCIHPSYQIKNLGSYVLSRILKMFDGDVVSFADSTQDHNGSVYKACGFNLIGEVGESYYYVDEFMNKYHKKTIYNQASRMKLSELDYTIKTGLIKVIEDIKYKYLYER